MTSIYHNYIAISRDRLNQQSPDIYNTFKLFKGSPFHKKMSKKVFDFWIKNASHDYTGKAVEVSSCVLLPDNY